MVVVIDRDGRDCGRAIGRASPEFLGDRSFHPAALPSLVVNPNVAKLNFGSLTVPPICRFSS
jgi:hypothetical protein